MPPASGRAGMVQGYCRANTTLSSHGVALDVSGGEALLRIRQSYPRRQNVNSRQKQPISNGNWQQSSDNIGRINVFDALCSVTSSESPKPRHWAARRQDQGNRFQNHQAGLYSVSLLLAEPHR